MASFLTAVPIMVLLTIVQTSVFPWFPALEVIPSLPFVLAMAWTLQAGLDEGIVWAFVAGLTMDIFSIAPVGGLSLSYMAAVLAAGLIKDIFPANRIVVPVLFAAVATAVQQLLYFLFLRIFGLPVSLTLVTFAQLIILQALLVLPFYWLLHFASRLRRPHPVRL